MALPVLRTDYVLTVTNGVASSITLTAPSTIVAGDSLYLFCMDDADNQATSLFETPAGFTSVGSAANGSNDTCIHVFKKDDAVGDEGDVTVQHSAVDDELMGWYIAVSGTDTTNSIHLVGTPSFAVAASLAIPAITTTVADCLAFYVQSFDGGDGLPFSVSGTGWVEQAEGQEQTDGNTVSGSFGTKEMTTAGDTLDATVSASVSDGITGFQFAIKGASASPQTIPINQVSETNTASSIVVAAAFSALLGQVVETDVAQAITTPQTAELAVTYNPKAGWDAVETLTANKDPDSFLKDFPGTLVDESIIYYPTTFNTTVGADGATITDSTQDISGQYWDKSDRTWKQVTYTIVFSVNQVTETDLSQPITASTSIIVSVGQTTETDLSQTIVPLLDQNISINQVLETDLSQPISVVPGAISETVNQANETDLAQSISFTSTVDIALNQVIETDLSQPITAIPGSVTSSIGQVLESDLAQPITPIVGAITEVLNQTNEIDLSQAIVPIIGGLNIPVNQVAEIDLSQPIIPVPGAITEAINQTNETDLAQTISLFQGTTVGIGQVAETDLAQSIASTSSVSIAVNQVAEIDTAQAITSITTAELAVSYNPKTGWAVVEALNAPIGVAGKVGENFTGDILDGSEFYYPTAFDTVITADGTISSNSTSDIYMQFWDKSDVTWKQVTLIIAPTVGTAIEVDIAQSITVVPGAISVPINQVTETSLAQSITSIAGTVSISVNQVVETDLAQSVTPLVGAISVPVNQASELDTVQPITPLVGAISVPVNQVVETDIAQEMVAVAGAVILMGQVFEVDTAEPIGALTTGITTTYYYRTLMAG